MAGIPPLAGFVGKFYLFSAAMDQGYLAIAYIGFVMSMISVHYYLSVVKVMFLAEGDGLPEVPVHGAMKFTMVFTHVDYHGHWSLPDTLGSDGDCCSPEYIFSNLE